MADPLPLKLPPRDPREALYQRLEKAPHEHAEALLATYDVLQGLHDKGVLDLLKGALGSSEKVLQILVDAGNTPEVIRGEMKYRKLGNTGLIVSEVALGTMQFGGKMNMGNLGQEDTTRMVKLALDRGINFIDTADVYSLGESETLVGNALKGMREEIVLATKVRLPMSENLNRSGATRVNIMREVEGSLRRLQTDYIDLYQVHGWDSNTPLEETLRTLDDLVRQGKVRYIGLSNLMSWQAATAVMLQERLGLGKIRDGTDVLQPRRPGSRVRVPVVRRVPQHRYSGLEPAGRRIPERQVQPHQPAPAGTRFAEAGQFVPFDKEMGYRVVDVLKEVAGRHDAKPGPCGAAWVLGRPAVSSVIVAARKAEQLEDNIRAVDLRLSDEDVRLLDAARIRAFRIRSGWSFNSTPRKTRVRKPVSRALRGGGPWKDLRGSRWSG
jgi:aryl-alcohol dehydrogenase-like predicted oxidoreductase